ncbi:RNA-binding protein Hfq [Caballeronia hypogeia]|uniref:RNA-binding protein Hfq n=1 Tax=Caballeronia hypogeia TaxID=1777140 RepID=A0A158A9B9_9BURK|nr:RNA chaperone Hfq [Caballeronia hypogeia]SAK54383.1 RNA-binding protein Hfq [Caballeronia hypogeia]
MNETFADIQSEFLRALVANQTPIWVFLINGIKLTGVVASFDQYVLSVQSASGTQIVYKNAVSTVIEQHTKSVGTIDKQRTARVERRPERYTLR